MSWDWRETENAVEVGRLCCFRLVRDPYVLVFFAFIFSACLFFFSFLVSLACSLLCFVLLGLVLFLFYPEF